MDRDKFENDWEREQTTLVNSNSLTHEWSTFNGRYELSVLIQTNKQTNKQKQKQKQQQQQKQRQQQQKKILFKEETFN
jgi:transcription initiation factor TFIID subunit TAF12